MAGNKEVNSNLQIKGKINLKDVPNNTPTGFLVWNSEIKDIAQRTPEQLLTDLNLITATNIAANYYTKPQVDTNIKTAVDNIQIGGKNLFERNTPIMLMSGASGLVKTKTGFNIVGVVDNNAIIRITNVIKSNGLYTLSFEHYIEYGGYSLNIDFCDGTPLATGSFDSKRWIKKTITYDVQNFSEDVYNFIDINGLTDQTHYFRNVKVEKGNKATDWSPNPLDQVADWNTTDVNDFSFLKNKPTKLSQFTNDSGYLTSIPTHSHSEYVTLGGVAQLITSKKVFNNEIVSYGNIILNHRDGHKAIELLLNENIDEPRINVISKGGAYVKLIANNNSPSIRVGNNSGEIISTGIFHNKNFVHLPTSRLVVGAFGDYGISENYSFVNIGKALIEGDLTANSFIKIGGTSTQFLKADGSIDNSQYVTASRLSYYAEMSWVNANFIDNTSSNVIDTTAWELRSSIFENRSGRIPGDGYFKFTQDYPTMGYGRSSLQITDELFAEFEDLAIRQRGSTLINVFEGSIYSVGSITSNTGFKTVDGVNNNVLLDGGGVRSINDFGKTYVAGDGISITGAKNTITNTKPNVVQTLSGSGNTVNLSNGGSHTIPAQSWGSITGKPATFPPENHTHDNFKTKYSYPNNITEKTTSESLCGDGSNVSAMMENVSILEGGFGNVFTYTGYQKFGSTQIITKYNGANGNNQIAFRVHNQSLDNYNNWVEIWTTDNLTLNRINNWNTAFNWGNHTGLYAPINHSHTFASITGKPATYPPDQHTHSQYLTQEADPTVPAHVKSISTGNIDNWNTAFGWGNHAGLYSSSAILGASPNSIRTADTRDTNLLPSSDLKFGTWFDFKSTSVLGIPSNYAWAGVMTLVPYGDDSGNNNAAFRLAQSNNKLFFQNYESGSWKNWNELWHSGNFNPDGKADAMQNAIGIGLSSGKNPNTDNGEYPYFYSTYGYIVLATRKWVGDNFDKYNYWNLQTNNVQRTSMPSGSNLNLVAGANVTISYSAGGTVTINAANSGVPANMVTTDTTQTISGVKTFSNTLAISPGNVIYLKSATDPAHGIRNFSDDTDGFFISSGFSIKLYNNLSSNLFHVNPSGAGTFSGSVTAPAFYEGSLKSLKKNIKRFKPSGLALVEQLDIVTFDRKDESAKNKIGIIADDSPKEFLSEELDAVDLYKTVFIQAKAIQELSDKHNKLEEEILNMKALLTVLLENK